MASAGVEQQRLQGMLSSLQMSDANIDNIEVYSKFVVAYLLQQEGTNPGWRKANIEGPVHLVRRRTAPRYQLLVKNQFSTNDLLDDLHPDWELDCQKNYVFYKVQDPAKRIRGLWFHDDNERKRMEALIEAMLKRVRAGETEAVAPPGPQAQGSYGGARQAQAQGSYGGVAISPASVKAALQALAEDEDFVGLVYQKLKNAASQQS